MVVTRIICRTEKIKVMENNKERRNIPYSEESYPPMPTKAILFWRRCIIWQAWRWLVLNIKILRIVAGGHS